MYKNMIRKISRDGLWITPSKSEIDVYFRENCGWLKILLANI